MLLHYTSQVFGVNDALIGYVTLVAITRTTILVPYP